jgi:hypothetical protein
MAVPKKVANTESISTSVRFGQNFIYGFTNNLSYKNFSLQVFFQGSYGNDMLNATRIETEAMIDPKNQSTAVNNRWRQPGDIT